MTSRTDRAHHRGSRGTSDYSAESIIRVNLTGTFLTAQHTIPHLLAGGGGAIVTTGSIESQVIALGGSAASYTASKGGVLQLTKQIAVDYGPQGIRANCLCPAVVRTRLPAVRRGFVHDRQRRAGGRRLHRCPSV